MTAQPQTRKRAQRGSILLLVLWVTAALSFVALSLAFRVRTEMAATRYRVEAEQGRFLAEGALQQALYLIKSPGLRDADGKLLYKPGEPLDFSYATGTARVTVASEAGKLNVNIVPVDRLQALLQAAGLDEGEARTIAAAIDEWRKPLKSAAERSALDDFYASLTPPYEAAHKPLVRLEELLRVYGITPEIYYGSVQRDPDGILVRRGGLVRLLTTFGNFGGVDANLAPYEVLRTVPGMTDEGARRLVAERRVKPYRTADDFPVELDPAVRGQLTLSGLSSVFTIYSAGRAYGSSSRSLVSATVERDPLTAQFKLLAWEERAVDYQALEAMPTELERQGDSGGAPQERE